MTNWSALEDAAAGMRRLNRALAAHEATDDELAELTATANALAERLERGGRRSKQEDMASANDGRRPHEVPPPAIGEAIRFDQFSAAGGRYHPCSVGVSFVRDGEHSISATATVDQMFQGPPGRVHGGVVAMLLDEVMGVVNRATATMAFTGRLTIDYRAAAPIDRELRFRAWRESIEGRKVLLRAEGRSDDGLFVEAEGLFITVPADVVAGAVAPASS